MGDKEKNARPGRKRCALQSKYVGESMVVMAVLVLVLAKAGRQVLCRVRR